MFFEVPRITQFKTWDMNCTTHSIDWDLHLWLLLSRVTYISFSLWIDLTEKQEHNVIVYEIEYLEWFILWNLKNVVAHYKGIKLKRKSEAGIWCNKSASSSSAQTTLSFQNHIILYWCQCAWLKTLIMWTFGQVCTVLLFFVFLLAPNVHWQMLVSAPEFCFRTSEGWMSMGLLAGVKKNDFWTSYLSIKTSWNYIWHY